MKSLRRGKRRNKRTRRHRKKQLHHIKLKKSGYEVCINKDGLCNKIDKIKTLEDAKQIYNLMASELFGEFAVLYID